MGERYRRTVNRDIVNRNASLSPNLVPENREIVDNFDETKTLIAFRNRAENYDHEVEAQAIGFIRQAMFSKHAEPNFHTPLIEKEDLEKLNQAETSEQFIVAVRSAYSDPAHMLDDAAKHFEDNFPGNGRNGDGLSSIFESHDGTVGVEIVNIRTRARAIIAGMREEFSLESESVPA